MISEWQSSIAHPDAADWVTVAAYLGAALLSARARAIAVLQRHSTELAFWRVASILLILLAVNELLDLQTLLTSIGRAHAKAHGWYEQRRAVQFMFVTGLGTVAVVAGSGLSLLLKSADPAVRLALAGFFFIGLFTVVRAASFHHLEMALGGGASGFNLGSMTEMAGIAIVAVAAALYLRKQAVSPG